MNGGVKGLLVAASFAAAGCAATPGTVEVRPIADPASKLGRGGDLLADAKGQLAVGNVGLALEGFRKASRAYPDNAEAFAGMAACYEAMRRYDLAELKYQAALALAPHNPSLLARLAGALDQQGKAEAAAEVRGEIAQIQLASAVLDDAQAEPEIQPELASAPLAPAQTVTVALPAATLVAPSVTLPEAKSTTSQAAEQEGPAIPAPRLHEQGQVNVVAGPPTQLRAPAIGELAPEIAWSAQAAEPRMPAPQLTYQEALNVLAGLPRHLAPMTLGQLAPVLTAAAEPAPARIEAARMTAPSTVNGAPRLERLSLGEVALLTGRSHAWGGKVVAASPQKVTARWVPLQMASTRPNIRILNAARSQGLAARNRNYLLDRGWRKIEIGDATEVRERSLVLYPATHPTIGRSLAAQFGCRAQPADTGGVFLVFLGRDVTGSRAASTRG